MKTTLLAIYKEALADTPLAGNDETIVEEYNELITKAKEPLWKLYLTTLQEHMSQEYGLLTELDVFDYHHLIKHDVDLTYTDKQLEIIKYSRISFELPQHTFARLALKATLDGTDINADEFEAYYDMFASMEISLHPAMSRNLLTNTCNYKAVRRIELNKTSDVLEVLASITSQPTQWSNPTVLYLGKDVDPLLLNLQLSLFKELGGSNDFIKIAGSRDFSIETCGLRDISCHYNDDVFDYSKMKKILDLNKGECIRFNPADIKTRPVPLLTINPSFDKFELFMENFQGMFSLLTHPAQMELEPITLITETTYDQCVELSEAVSGKIDRLRQGNVKWVLPEELLKENTRFILYGDTTLRDTLRRSFEVRASIDLPYFVKTILIKESECTEKNLKILFDNKFSNIYVTKD